jgi:hypothetical protein
VKERPDPRAALAAAAEGEERFSLVDALGGGRGIVDSVLPGAVFVTAYTVTSGALAPSLWAAVAAGAVAALIRLVRRESLQFALSGFVGIAICAFIAERTGRAEDFFLPGLLINIGYAAAYAVSIVLRWPLLGVIVGPITGEGMAWRRDPVKLRAYQRASWIWVAMFLLRIAVQAPLYFAGAVVALGVARIAMGWPLFLVSLWLSWLVLRKAYGQGRTNPEPGTSRV